MLPRRIAFVLAIGLIAVTVLALIAGVAPSREAAPAVPAAHIDLGGTFGQQNEADEDEKEPEEDAGLRRQSPQGTSFLSVLLAVVAGLVGLGILLRQVRLLRGR
jgi:hypothetical protein